MHLHSIQQIRREIWSAERATRNLPQAVTNHHIACTVREAVLLQQVVPEQMHPLMPEKCRTSVRCAMMCYRQATSTMRYWIASTTHVGRAWKTILWSRSPNRARISVALNAPTRCIRPTYRRCLRRSQRPSRSMRILWFGGCYCPIRILAGVLGQTVLMLLSLPDVPPVREYAVSGQDATFNFAITAKRNGIQIKPAMQLELPDKVQHAPCPVVLEKIHNIVRFLNLASLLFSLDLYTV